MSKKTLSLLIAFLMVFTLLQTENSFATSYAKKAITIKDTKLKAEIIKVLKKKTGATIYDTECAAIKTLKLSSKGIKDVSALAYFKALTNADFSNNSLSSVLVFKNLKNLKTLNLKGMKIKKSEIDTLLNSLPKCVIEYDSSKVVDSSSPGGGTATPSPKPISGKEQIKLILLDGKTSANWDITIKMDGKDEEKHNITFDGSGDIGTFSDGNNYHGKYSILDEISIEPTYATYKLTGKFDGKGISGKVLKSSRYGDIESGTWSGTKNNTILYDMRGEWKITFSDPQIAMSVLTMSFEFGKWPSKDVDGAIAAGCAKIIPDGYYTQAYGPYTVVGDTITWTLYERRKYEGKIINVDLIEGKMYEYQSYWASFKAERIKE